MFAHRLTSKAETRVDESAFLRSDDDCVQKLAILIERRDSKDLGEIARLIGRLAIPLE
jgi:hypothetical protein